MKIKILVITIITIFCIHGIYSIVQFSELPKNSRDFSHEEIRRDFEIALKEWSENQDFMEIYNVQLDCDIDETFLKRDLNQKAFQNIFLQIDLFHKPIEINQVAMDYADEVYDSIRECLYRDTTYGNMIHQIDVYRYAGENKNGGCVGSRQMILTYTGKQNQVKQSKDELHAQTIAYDYVKELRQRNYFKDGGDEIPYGSPVLTRFGIDSVSQKLLIEIEMSTPEKHHMNAFKESLENLGNELFELFMMDKKTKKYLEENTVSAVVVKIVTAAENNDFHYEYCREIQD